MPKSKTNLTVRQVMAGFSVSDMTIYTWRQGTATRPALPVVIDGRRVSFEESSMKAYAKAHGLKFDAAAAHAVEAGTLGPKAKVVKAAPAKKVVAKKAKATTVADLPSVSKKPRRPKAAEQRV